MRLRRGMKIGVIGAGGWGTALARLLVENGHQVKIWSYEQETATQINEFHYNPKFLPGVELPSALKASTDPDEIGAGREMLVFAVPSQWLRSVALLFKPYASADTLVVNAGKGIEVETLKSLSTVLGEELGVSSGQIVALSGPNHSEEVGRGFPSATVVASPDLQAAETVQDVFISSHFRVYTNPDRLGVELGGALKNVYALAAGICEGLGYEENTKAAVVTRGLAEMRRLGEKMGALPLTFSGLSGLGDLFATAAGRHSRNAWAGREIGRGRKVHEVLASTAYVVEGVPTTKAAYRLGEKLDVELPIVEVMYRVLFEDFPPQKAVEVLMSRDRRHELERLE